MVSETKIFRKLFPPPGEAINMGYHPRIEAPDLTTFITTRTKSSEMWFTNNPSVERYALELLAKLCERYRAKLYAFALEGSHTHKPAEFPLQNRADFMRDFNSGLAVNVAKLTPNYSGGKLWQRRYSGELLPGAADIENQFFYTVLQPVSDGLVEKISDYPFYNCFHDAVCGIRRKFKTINWAKYRAKRRYNSSVKPTDFIEMFTLKYDRIPGYENLSQHEYRVMMEKKLEERRLKILAERQANGKSGFVGRAALLATVPGTKAKNPKLSDIDTHRPRVLSVSFERRADTKAWYFKIYFEFKLASRRYRAGEIDVEFPPGTYRPPTWMVTHPSGPYSLFPQ